MSYMFDRAEPSCGNQFQLGHARLLENSFRQLLGKALDDCDVQFENFGQLLYEAPYGVLAHDGADDPIFFYANLAAQKLFNYSWEEFVSLPSRLSAEAQRREERQALLERVSRDGFIDDYCGVRIASDGTRFLIEDAIVWNLHNGDSKCGQAALIKNWQTLTPKEE